MKASAERIQVFTGHQGAVYCLANGYAPKTILSGGSDKQVIEWDLENQQPPKILARSTGVIYSLLVIPEEPILCIGNNAGGIHIIDLARKAEVHYLLGHTGGVFHLNYLAELHILLSSGADGNVCVWSATDFHCKHRIATGTSKVRQLALSLDGKTLVLACDDGVVRMYSTHDFSQISAFQVSQQALNALTYSPDGGRLIIGTKDAHLHVFDAKSYQLLKSIPAHNYAIYQTQFSPNNKYFSTASRDKTIKIWDPETLDIALRIDAANHSGHVNSVNALVWDEQTGLLASAGDDRSVLVWKID